MDICSDNEHGEIVYDERRRCPACRVINELRDEIDTLKIKIEDLESELAARVEASEV